MIARFLPVLILTTLFVLLLPSSGFALVGTDTVVGNMMCVVSGWMHGSTGKGLATLGVIMLGLLALFNKISWGIALIHAVGGVMIVEASYIINSLDAGGTGCI